MDQTELVAMSLRLNSWDDNLREYAGSALTMFLTATAMSHCQLREKPVTGKLTLRQFGSVSDFDSRILLTVYPPYIRRYQAGYPVIHSGSKCHGPA